MKTNQMRSMRDIPTIQGLHNHAVSANREKAVTELARLEHEQARLQRELDMWQANQRKTERRLQQVQERLALVQAVLSPPDTDGSPRRTEARRSSEEEVRRDRPWQEVKLEY